jgi:hypothetical protein
MGDQAATDAPSLARGKNRQRRQEPDEPSVALVNQPREDAGGGQNTPLVCHKDAGFAGFSASHQLSDKAMKDRALRLTLRGRKGGTEKFR